MVLLLSLFLFFFFPPPLRPLLGGVLGRGGESRKHVWPVTRYQIKSIVFNRRRPFCSVSFSLSPINFIFFFFIFILLSSGKLELIIHLYAWQVANLTQHPPLNYPLGGRASSEDPFLFGVRTFNFFYPARKKKLRDDVRTQKVSKAKVVRQPILLFTHSGRIVVVHENL